MKKLSNIFILPILLLSSSEIYADARSSSHLVDSMKSLTTYIPQNAIDGDPSTAWVEGEEGFGKNATLEVDIPKGTIKKIGIIPGFGPDSRQFKRYSRIKTMRIEVFSRDDEGNDVKVKSGNVNLKDEYGFQYINMGDIKVGEELFGGFIRFTIIDVYKGLDFLDTAISEVKVLFDEFDAQVVGAASSSNLQGFGPENITDGNKKTAWIPEEGEGGGIGEWVEIDTGDYGVSRIGIIPGYAKDATTWKEYGRIKDILVEVGGKRANFSLKDKNEIQFFELPYSNGYTGSLFGPVKITILTTYPGSKTVLPAISDVVIKATNLSM